MDVVRPSLPYLAASALLAALVASAAAQTGPQDGIDRTLLQREQQEREFHVRLYEQGQASGQNALIPLPPVKHSFVGRELSQPPPVPGAKSESAAAGGLGDQQLLNDSQLRRQLELQTQNRWRDEPTRQQQSQIQQLQFGRENQAQQLQQQIQRGSGLR